MTLREKATRLCALIGVCSLGIYLAACNYGELPVDGEGTGKVELRFSASISNSPSTKAAPQQPAQPTMVSGFGMGDALGLFITRDGSALTAGSDDNMKSVLTEVVSSQKWEHFKKDGHSSLSLEVKNNDFVNIKGYYPWREDATATAVPFDLSDTDPRQWIDLLYLSSPASDVNTKIIDGMPPIDLQFSHAFCRVTINLTRLSEKSDVQVKAVTIGNAYAGQKTILNQGSLNLNTGEITGTSGPLKIEQNGNDYIVLDKTIAATYEFLVPPVMHDSIDNSDIVFDVTTKENGAEKVLTFPLLKTHLNEDGTKHGFQKGMHNTYNIVYNNASMNLSLSDWHSVEIGETTLGVKPSELGNATVRMFCTMDIVMLSQNGESSPSYDRFVLPKDDHSYHTYLGEIAENNNGKDYILNIDSKSGNHTNAWREATLAEMVCGKLNISTKYAAGEAQLPWKDIETGSLLAKQACVEYREGGYTDWRLPRISECYMMVFNPDQRPSEGGLYNPGLGTKEFWSATEANADSCYAAVYDAKVSTSNYYVNKFSKQELFYVRCVRDADKPKPAK
ncbi:fimbrillin family protein [Parabacteroides gordonii]|uniref:fimbrillin family protein n=1 Tax=Parabacteroides gordonii TaxID=574930 RepID=UPI0026EB20C3|nr:fimbrillin family protein [Parabacteroides gordonii]